MRVWLRGVGSVLLLALVAGGVLVARVLHVGAAEQPVVELGRHAVRVVATRQVVPGPGLPDSVAVGASNNNLDVVRHSDGRTYLAFRTAPHHFANSDTAIQVVSSADEVTWDAEVRFAPGHDLREPRFLSWRGVLFLYVSKLGRDPLAFEPQGMAFAERGPDGGWSALTPLDLSGRVGWRVRTLRGLAVMLAYAGGENLYSGRRPDLRVELWKSSDGRSWEPFDPAHPFLYRGGGSEADFAEGDDGTLYGVIRNEAGDDSGWGSRVCRARPDAPGRWDCRGDRRKFDSPFAFWHDGEAYLVARRHLRGNGDYDLGRGPGWLLRTLWNQVNYSLAPKRCSLWRYVRDEDRFAFVLDLPSRGDTCFPAVIRGREPGAFAIYDYSCDLDGPDLRWLEGQRGETFIYRHELRFEERGDAAPGGP